MSPSRKGGIGEMCEDERGSRDAELRTEMSEGTAVCDAQCWVECMDTWW